MTPIRWFLALATAVGSGGRRSDADSGWVLVGSPTGKSAIIASGDHYHVLTPDGPGPALSWDSDALDSGFARIALADDGHIATLHDGVWQTRVPGETDAWVPRRGGAVLLFPQFDGPDRLIGFVPGYVSKGPAWVGMKESDYRAVTLDLHTGEATPITDEVFLNVRGAALAGDELDFSATLPKEEKDVWITIRRGPTWEESDRRRNDALLKQRDGIHRLGIGQSPGFAGTGWYPYDVVRMNPGADENEPVTALRTYVVSFVAMPDGTTYVQEDPKRNKLTRLVKIRDRKSTVVPWPGRDADAAR